MVLSHLYVEGQAVPYRTPLRSLSTREVDGRRSGSTALTTAIRFCVDDSFDDNVDDIGRYWANSHSVLCYRFLTFMRFGEWNDTRRCFASLTLDQLQRR